MRTRVLVSAALSLFLAAGCCLLVSPAFAQSSQQDGKLKVHVQPKQAYVFVEGQAIREGNQTIHLPAGTYKVSIHNYGYEPKTEKVQITAGQTSHLNVALQPSGGLVSGPFAEIEFKGDPRAAVLLDGRTPAYFVGHVDEFDWDWIWHQRLLVRPGTYHVTVTRKGAALWSGPVTAKAGQHVIVYLNQNGKTKTKTWNAGLTMGPQPRFKVGLASATIPIAPVSATFGAAQRNLSCGQSTSLSWNSANAVDTSLTGIGEVAGKGDRSVEPKHNMTYVLTAKGPGGVVTRKVMISVDTQPTATLALSQPEIRYRKVGDKVVEQGSATLNWSATNATSASLEPFGSGALSGRRTIEADPNQTHTGPVNQTITYTFTTSNACGGTVTKTATLHIVGSIDPPPSITLASMFYPTAFPTRKHPKVGLVASEKAQLAKLAENFKNDEPYYGNGRLMIVGHADVRGPQAYNQRLSERRADLVRNFLVAHGVPADELQTRAVGKDQQLSEKQVAVLQAKDPQKPERWEAEHKKATWLAYNRRVDIILEPKGQDSTQAYPNDVASARILWERRFPALKAVVAASHMRAAQLSASVQRAPASTGRK